MSSDAFLNGAMDSYKKRADLMPWSFTMQSLEIPFYIICLRFIMRSPKYKIKATKRALRIEFSEELAARKSVHYAKKIKPYRPMHRALFDRLGYPTWFEPNQKIQMDQEYKAAFPQHYAETRDLLLNEYIEKIENSDKTQKDSLWDLMYDGDKRREYLISLRWYKKDQNRERRK